MTNTNATYSRLADMAERISNLRHRRADAAFIAAGVGVQRNVAHNALLALRAGRPWRGVNYSKLRLGLRIDDSRSEPFAVLDRWYRRANR